MTKFPGNCGEVTAEWMQTVLEDVSVDKVTVDAGSEQGQNYACHVIRVIVDGFKNGKAYTEPFVVKITPTPEWHRKFVRTFHIFEREFCFYKEMLADFINKQKLEEKVYLSIPKCIHAQRNQNGDGIIVLKDLQPQGYIMPIMRKGHDIEHCKLVLHEIAKFHAMGYNVKYSTKTPAKQLYPSLYDPLFIALADTAFYPMFLACIQRSKDLLAKTDGYQRLGMYMETVGRNLIENYKKTLLPVEPFSTFCHGDLWNNNTMFKYDKVTGKPVSVKIIDFQIVQYCCPTIDLINYFSSTTTPALRKESFKELLQLYHNTLFKYLDLFGVTEINRNNFSFEELCRLYYEYTGYYGLLQAMVFCPIMLPKENLPDMGNEAMQSMEEALEALNNSTEAVLKCEDIKLRLLGLIEEMAKNGVGI